MKVAILGTGKTGGLVAEILGTEGTTYNSSNPPTATDLQKHDVVIVFLTGPVFLEYIDILIESGVPVVNGSTGFDWPDDIDSRLKTAGVAWITASNFSLGMNLIYGMIKVLAKASQLFDSYEFKLHELHHIHKKDQPSGTSLAWQKWLSEDAHITSAREGDNPGNHRLTLQTPYEDISIEHQAKDRKAFAEGAVWTAKKILDGTVAPGLHDLPTIMKKELNL